MSVVTDVEEEITQLWYTRCPVPTASGLAYSLGWLRDGYAGDGVEIGILQEAPLEIARHHFDHDLVGLLREGGNVPAFAARADGAPTRLIGLTWIEELQSIVVRPDAGIREPSDLRGARLGVPAWASTRDTSMGRAMALHGFLSALRLGGLTWDDVTLVEIPIEPVVPPRDGDARSFERAWPGLAQLVDGQVDAIYLKGGSAVEAIEQAGAVVGINLDLYPDKRVRVNNGTPRPLTVHQQLLDDHPELVVQFLVQTLRAAEWAEGNPDRVREILAREVRSGAHGVEVAYGEQLHTSLRPSLSDERLELFDRQKEFLLLYGFLARDFDLAGWVDHEPLRAAREIVAAGGGPTGGSPS
ncbi:MAG: ABC transporter substrate-binding protein [Acidimicrobiia bacterium]